MKKHPNEVFIFGDNLDRKGTGGAAKLRSESNTYGFITKKHPNNRNTDFYTPEEYRPVYENEINKLKLEIKSNPDKVYLISKLGGGLANKYNIREQVIQKNIEKDLAEFDNVEFL